MRDPDKIERLNQYRCKDCGKILLRQRNRTWVRAHCSKTNRVVRAYRVMLPNTITEPQPLLGNEEG